MPKEQTSKLNKCCIRAIKQAFDEVMVGEMHYAPFPGLPEDYPEDEKWAEGYNNCRNQIKTKMTEFLKGRE